MDVFNEIAQDTAPRKRPAAAIITINGNRFVSGLLWQSLTRPRGYMKEAKEIGKREGLDIVAIRDTAEARVAEMQADIGDRSVRAPFAGDTLLAAQVSTPGTASPPAQPVAPAPVVRVGGHAHMPQLQWCLTSRSGRSWPALQHRPRSGGWVAAGRAGLARVTGRLDFAR